MEKPELEVDDILNVLWTLRKHRGAAKVDRASGMGSAAIRSRLRGDRRLTVGDLSALLTGMEVDAVEFAAWRAAGFHPEVYLRQLGNQRRSQVRHIRALAARAPAADCTAEEIGKKVEGLELLRLFDADAARKAALEVLRTAEHRPRVVDRDSVCGAWEILGTIQRSRGTYSSSADCLRRALVLGSRGRVSTLRRTSTLQRVAYLMGYQGDFEPAGRVLEVARLIAARARDWRATGRVLVSVGGLLGRTGRLEESIEAYDASLRLLPPREWHGRYSALVGLGVSRLYAGDSEEALGRLDQALAELDRLASPPPLMTSWVVWFRAEIHLLRQELPAAKENLQAVRDVYVAQRMRPLDVALVSLRLAKVLVLEGQVSELRQLTREVGALLGPIERQNPLVAGTFAEFHRLAIRGELTAELLEGFYRAAHEDARKAPPLLPLS